MNKKNLIFSISAAIIFSLLIIFLQTRDLYGYIYFVLLGVIIFFISEKSGKEPYIVLLLPIIIISVNAIGSLFLLDYSNANGLNSLKIHPLSLTWLTIFMIEFVRKFLSRNFKFDRLTILAFLIILSYGLITIMKRGTSGISLLVENYLAPISFFLIVYNEESISWKRVAKILKAVLIIGVLLGICGIFEYLTKINIFDGLYINGYDILFHNETYRIFTIIGHPLMNAVFFMMMMIFNELLVPRKSLKYALHIFFLMVIVLTGSRSIFIISLLILMYDKNFSFKKLWKETVIKAVSCLLVLVIIFQTPLGDTFLDRMKNGEQSTNARVMLLKYSLDNFKGFKLNGLGDAGENLIIYDSATGEEIIPENPWIMLFWDMNFLSLLYVAFLFILIFRKISYKFLAIVFLIGLSAFNSFGVKSNVNYYLFFIITVLYIENRQRKVNYSDIKHETI